MTRQSIQAALAKMQMSRDAAEAQREACDEAIKNLEIALSSLDECHLETRRSDQQLSYVRLAIAVLEEIGKPTPITVLLERIRQRRNDPTITRGSVETSLLRYLTTKGAEADFIKACPGTYVLRRHSDANANAAD